MIRCAAPRSIRLCLVIAAAATLAACAPRSASAPASPRPAPTLPDVVRIGSSGRVVAVPLEQYVLGTALAEVGPTGESDDTAAAIFRLQAILARTYAARHVGRHRAEGFDLCDTTHCQVYDPARIRTSRFAAIARRAVADTAGQVVTVDARLAEALFHADCGGHTTAAEMVWGNPVSYLIGTPDPAPEHTHRHWEFRVPIDQLREALGANPASAVGDRLASVRVVERDASGRAVRVEVAGAETKVVRGEQFRSILTQKFGYRTLLSTKFTVTREAEGYLFTGSGFGHGVGLCQVGAAARLRRGDSIRSVLAAYYAGAQITRLTR